MPSLYILPLIVIVWRDKQKIVVIVVISNDNDDRVDHVLRVVGCPISPSKAADSAGSTSPYLAGSEQLLLFKSGLQLGTGKSL